MRLGIIFSSVTFYVRQSDLFLLNNIEIHWTHYACVVDVVCVILYLTPNSTVQLFLLTQVGLGLYFVVRWLHFSSVRIYCFSPSLSCHCVCTILGFWTDGCHFLPLISDSLKAKRVVDQLKAARRKTGLVQPVKLAGFWKALIAM